MKYLKRYTVIRIDNEALEKLIDVRNILDDITNDLDNIRKEEDIDEQLYDDVWKAYAYFDHFLESYNSTISSN